MVREPFEQPEYREGIDADAVCSQCGTVNPEGTLLCKKCGNNLRDQRLLRMTADQMLDAEVDGIPKSSFLFKALPILGLLIVLWLGLNAGRISSMLTTAGDTSGSYTISSRPQVFWEGTENDIYESLHARLMTRFPSHADAESARLEMTPLTAISDGIYALYERSGTMERFVGAAIVSSQGNVLHYAAQLNGNVEIRGRAMPFDEALAPPWEEAGMLYEGVYYALAGVATLRQDGAVQLSGQCDHNTLEYESVAYKISNH